MQKGLYIRIAEGPHVLLLASDESVAIEHRARLQRNIRPTQPAVTAWLRRGGEQWPAVRLSTLLGFEGGEWDYAVFMRGAVKTVGLAAQDVRLMQDSYGAQTKPFIPAGGHIQGQSIYNGVLIGSGDPTLVLDRPALTALITAQIDS